MYLLHFLYSLLIQFILLQKGIALVIDSCEGFEINNIV